MMKNMCVFHVLVSDVHFIDRSMYYQRGEHTSQINLQINLQAENAYMSLKSCGSN